MRQPPSFPVRALALVPGRKSWPVSARITPRGINARLPRRSRAPIVAACFTMFLAFVACTAASAASGSFSLASWMALTPEEITAWASTCLTTQATVATCTRHPQAIASTQVIPDLRITKHLQIVRIPTIAPGSQQSTTGVIAQEGSQAPVSESTAAPPRHTARETEHRQPITPTAASRPRSEHDS